MANTNTCRYIVAALFIVGLVVLIVYFTTSTDNSGDTSFNINTKKWPIQLPKSPHCGLASVSNKIIGGGVVQFDEHTWAALLKYQHADGLAPYNCGGALINHEYVITAAQCLTDSQHKLIGVVLGEQDLYNDIDCYTYDPDECAYDKPVLYQIAKTIIHPEYSSETKQNDIALLKLNTIVKFNEITKSICLPDVDHYMQHLSTPVFAVGWGLTNISDGSSESSVKKIVNLQIWDREICAQKFQTVDTQICAGGDVGKASCTYDTGGPLVRLAHISPPTWFLEGIISHGFHEACGVNGVPGIYTNVSAYMDWIKATVVSR